MTDPVPGKVTLQVYDVNLGTSGMSKWTLSPGVTISRYVQKDTFQAPIALGGFKLLDFGLPTQNTITITGKMDYSHNTKKPIDVMEEISNHTLYHATTYGQPEITRGYFTLQIEETITEGNFVWDGMIKSIQFDLEAGMGNIVDYTIIMDITKSPEAG